MRPRVVDWLLLLFVLIEVAGGLGSFLIGKPEGRFWFVAHGAVGLAILVLIYWKLRRVHPRVTDARRMRWSTGVSILLLLTALASIGTGVIWTVFQVPVAYPNGMILHTTAGIALLVVILWHLALRYKPLTRRDLRSRRSLVALLGALAFGGIAWIGQDRLTRALQTPGARRRFTGSRRADVPGTAQGNGSFPVTMWMFDNPAPIDPARYRFELTGAVERPLALTLSDLRAIPTEVQTVTIDCTGGWYSTQEWQGIRVADLLDQAGVVDGARVVSFISGTGYRWSLPLEEARAALLASHVGGEPLSHGHGAPLRLVAPGRRGFQWVKWVVAVDVRRSADLGQWRVIYTSGLSG